MSRSLNPLAAVALVGTLVLVTPPASAQLSILRKGNETVNVTASSGDRMGAALAAGDFDGDGYDDLAMGIPGEDGSFRRGRVVVNRGSEFGLRWPSWRNLSPDDFGHPAGDDLEFGHALAVADLNLDGFDDLIVGAPYADVGGVTDAGLVAVYMSGPGGLSNTPIVLDQSDLGGSIEANDRLGQSLTAGPVGDSPYPAVVIGSPGEDAYQGALVIAFSNSGGLSGASQFLKPTDLGVSASPQDGFAYSLALGDFWGDDRVDLLIGSPGVDVGGASNAGALYLVKGVASGFDPADSLTYDATDAGLVPEGQDLLGYSVAAGHLTLGTRDQFAASMPGWFNGRGRVLLGFTTLLGQPVLDEGVDQADGGQLMGAGDRFGTGLAVGDFDFDGYDDLAVGSPWESLGSAPVVDRAGLVQLFYGGELGPGQYGFELWGELDLGGQFGDNAELGAALCFGRFGQNTRRSLAAGAPGKDFDKGHVYDIAPWRQVKRPGTTSSMAVNCDQQVVFAQKPFERVKIASTTKIMTVLLACEAIQDPNHPYHVELDDTYAIEDWMEVGFPEGTKCSAYGFADGEIMSIEGLMRAAMMLSGNDACYALADALTGEVSEWSGSTTTCPTFVQLMNDRGAELGMLDTLFTNPAGTDGGDPHSTAYDMMVLAHKAMKNPLFADIAGTKTWDYTRTTFVGGVFSGSSETMNYGWLQTLDNTLPTATGLKPGGTPAAGTTAVISATAPVFPFGQVFAGGFGWSSGSDMYTKGTSLAQLALKSCGYDLGFSEDDPPSPKPPVAVGGLTLGPVPSQTKTFMADLLLDGDVSIDVCALDAVGTVTGTIAFDHDASVVLPPGGVSTHGSATLQAHGGIVLRNQSETDSVMFELRTSHPAGVQTVNLAPGATWEEPSLSTTAGQPWEISYTNLGTEDAFLGLSQKAMSMTASLGNGTAVPKTATVQLGRDPHAWSESMRVTLSGFAGAAGPVEAAVVVRDSSLVWSYDPCVARWSNYGTGLQGELGVPSLLMDAEPVLGTTAGVLVGSSRSTAGTTWLVVGFGAVDLPTNKVGHLLVTPDIVTPAPLPAGGMTLPLTVPNDPLLCGLSLYAQNLVVDRAAVAGYAFSRGLRLTFGDPED